MPHTETSCVVAPCEEITRIFCPFNWHLFIVRLFHWHILSSSIGADAYFFFDFRDTAKWDACAALLSLLCSALLVSIAIQSLCQHSRSLGFKSPFQEPYNQVMICSWSVLRGMLTLPGIGPTYIIPGLVKSMNL